MPSGIHVGHLTFPLPPDDAFSNDQPRNLPYLSPLADDLQAPLQRPSSGPIRLPIFRKWSPAHHGSRPVGAAINQFNGP